MSTSGIALFWGCFYVALLVLWRHPRSSVSRIAFTWIGPLPQVGETWAHFQLRWCAYSLSWLMHLCAGLSLTWVIGRWFPALETVVIGGLFVFTLAAATAAAAALGFLVKAGKAKLLGPNPVFAEASMAPEGRV